MSNTRYKVPCAVCGGRGPHEGPGHAYTANGRSPAYTANDLLPALARYNTMVQHDHACQIYGNLPLPTSAWTSIRMRLQVACSTVTGQAYGYVLLRVRDAAARADYARAHGRLRPPGGWTCTIEYRERHLGLTWVNALARYV